MNQSSAPPNAGGQPKGTLLLLTLLNVSLQLASAALIKFATIYSDPVLALIALTLVVVLALNVGRFAVWNLIHKRYPLSMAYPLSALFFPAVVLFAWFMDETVEAPQIAGALLVASGVIWSLTPEREPQVRRDV